MPCGYDRNGQFICDAGTDMSGVNDVASMNKFMANNKPVNTFDVNGNINPFVPNTNSNNVASWFSKLFNGESANQNLSVADQLSGKYGFTADQLKNMNALDQAEALLKAKELNNLDNFDWQGWTGAGLAGLNTVMDLGMYKPKIDYMNKSADALDQNISLAQDEWDNRKAARQNYSSAFSNNS